MPCKCPMATKFGRKNPGPKWNALLGLKVMLGQLGSTRGQIRNALWLPNLVGRTPDQSVMHCWVKGHAGVSWGQPGVKLLRNALWLPNLVGRTPDQSVMHCWVKGHAGSVGVNQRSNCFKMPYGYQNLVGRTADQSVMHCWGQRSCRHQLGSTRNQIA